MQTPNLIYYAVIFAWPLLALKIFGENKQKSILLLVLIPYLFMAVPPKDWVPLDVPILPPLDKYTVPSLVLILVLYIKKQKITWLPEHGLGRWLAVAFFLFPVFTVALNSTPLYYGPRVLPGLNLKEILTIEMRHFFELYVPFAVGYTFFRKDADHRLILKIIAITGLVYSLLMLYEVRMSPQLHLKVYGFLAADWAQQYRQGGFRPTVFIGHGLFVAMYASLSFMALFYLWKFPVKDEKKWSVFAALYMGAVLVLCKTYSAIIFCAIAVMISFIPAMRLRFVACSVVAVVLLCYPVLRQFVPLADIISFFEDINPERAQSFQFRVENEDMLLDKALEKPIFGWGTWGRSRIYSPIDGGDLSITDGGWLIVFGQFGWLGYLAVFGLITYPIIAVGRISKRIPGREPMANQLALSVILSTIILNQIPNIYLTHITFLISGALLGRAYEMKSSLVSNKKSGSKISSVNPAGGEHGKRIST